MRTLIIAVALVSMLSVGANAQVSYEGCVDIHGLPVPAVADYEMHGIAKATVAPDGKPGVIYNPNVLSWLSPQTRLFFYAHECGHHALGHDFSTTFPLQVEQQADCWSIRTLVNQGKISKDDVRVIQADLARINQADWTRVPGPVRAFDLAACLAVTGEPAPSPAPIWATFCCDATGTHWCRLSQGEVVVGAPCGCAGMIGRGTGCN